MTNIADLFTVTPEINHSWVLEDINAHCENIIRRCSNGSPDALAELRRFDMDVWFNGKTHDYIRTADLPACGTSACYLGHAPVASERAHKFIKNNNNFAISASRIAPHYDDNTWLFGGKWAGNKPMNTIVAAVDRSKWALAGNKIMTDGSIYSLGCLPDWTKVHAYIREGLGDDACPELPAEAMI